MAKKKKELSVNDVLKQIPKKELRTFVLARTGLTTYTSTSARTSTFTPSPTTSHTYNQSIPKN